MVSILILLDYLFLFRKKGGILSKNNQSGFNPYFIGLPILMVVKMKKNRNQKLGFNPYFIGLPILIFSVFNLI